RQVERLVQHGPRVRIAAQPAEPARKLRVDRHEVDQVPRLTEPGAERLRLDRLAADDVEARRDDRDPHGSSLVRSRRTATLPSAGGRGSSPTRSRAASPPRRTAPRSPAAGPPRPHPPPTPPPP